MSDISDFELKYLGKEVDFNKFLELFEPNGSEGMARLDFRFYLSEDEDEDALFASYEEDDPREYDFSDPDDVDDGEEPSISYEDYPYPCITIFAELKKRDYSYTIAELNICKVYESSWPLPGTHSSYLTDFEEEYIEGKLGPILKG